MTHRIEWLAFPRILYVELYGDLRLEDLEAFSRDTIQHLDEAETTVHMIIDDSKVGKPPLQIKKIQEALEYTRHPLLGWQVAIGLVNPIVNYVAPKVMRLIGVKLVRYRTKEEALEFLSEKDSTL